MQREGRWSKKDNNGHAERRTVVEEGQPMMDDVHAERRTVVEEGQPIMDDGHAEIVMVSYGLD
jgi:hypothetical protein